MKEKLGERMRYFRVKQGLTQQNVADELGLSNAQYSNIERGESAININRLFEIAEILKTTPIELLDFDNSFSDSNEIYMQGVKSQIHFLNQQVNLLQQQVAALRNEMKNLQAGK